MAPSAWDETTVRRVIDAHKERPGALLPILHALQTEFGHVPRGSIPLIAEALDRSRAEIHGVIGFYPHFREQAPGAHVLQICRGESCLAMGGEHLAEHAKERLGCEFHGTRADGAVTLEPVYCLGQCGCSPALQFDGEVYGRMTPARLDELLREKGLV